jgi:hypothetical protein
MDGPVGPRLGRSSRPARGRERGRDSRGTVEAVHGRGTPPAERLLSAFAATVVVFVVGAVLMWALEDGYQGGDIHGFGDAAFFVAVQLLTVSSQIKNPVTSGGKVVDVVLEIWAIFVVTAVAGRVATFFSSGDSS